MSDAVDDVEKKSGDESITSEKRKIFSQSKSTELCLKWRILSLVSLMSVFLLLLSNIFRNTHIIESLKLIVPLFVGLLVLTAVIVFFTGLIPKLLHVNARNSVRIVSKIAAIVISVILVIISSESLISRVNTSLESNGIERLSATINDSTLTNILNFILQNNQPLIFVATVILGILSIWILYHLLQALLSSIISNFTQNRKEYFKRLLLLLPPISFLLYLYMIYSPLEIFFGNPDDMGVIIFSDIVLPSIIVFIVTTLLLLFFLSLFRGKIYAAILCLSFGISVASYVQMMFLNGGLGLLNGVLNPEFENPLFLIINCLIWVAIITIVLVFYHFYKSIMQKIIKYGSVALILILVVATVSMVCTAPSTAFERDNSYYLCSENQLKLSPNENIILFIVDFDSNEYLDSVLSFDEKWATTFSDFTYYNNAENRYMMTCPSVNHILSGYDFDPETMSLSEWLTDSWKSENTNFIYSSIADNSYDIGIYTLARLLGGVNSLFESGLISNIVSTNGKTIHIESWGLLSKLLETSSFRLFPNAIKLMLFNHLPSSYEDCVYYDNTAGILQNYDFYNMLQNTRLSLMPTENNLFTVTHIEGTHPPYHTTSDCEYAYSSTVGETQIGCLVLLEEYINQMKSLGVYDSSTIIITADHGNFGFYSPIPDQQPIFLIKEPYAQHNTLQINTTPIMHCEILPTVLSIIGIDYSGRNLQSIYDIDQNEDRVRSHYDKDGDEYYLYEYSGDRHTLFNKMKNEEYTFIPKR